MGRRHRDARQCPAELDLTRFDPAAEADLLLSRQQMDLADLLVVEADGILGRASLGRSLPRRGQGFLEDDG